MYFTCLSLQCSLLASTQVLPCTSPPPPLTLGPCSSPNSILFWAHDKSELRLRLFLNVFFFLIRINSSMNNEAEGITCQYTIMLQMAQTIKPF